MGSCEEDTPAFSLGVAFVGCDLANGLRAQALNVGVLEQALDQGLGLDPASSSVPKGRSIGFKGLAVKRPICIKRG